MKWYDSIADERIREAQARGDFDRLPGAGKPLPPEDDAGVPDDLKAGFRLLKNAGVLPEEMQVRKEVVTLEDLLAACRDDTERARLDAELSAKKLRYRMLMEERGWSSIGAFVEYESAIQRKMTES